MHRGAIRPSGATALLLLALALGLPAAPAAGQSESELRRTNQALQAQVRDLQKELEAARAQIRVLQAENDLMRKDLEAVRQGVARRPPPPPQQVTIDESVPGASPPALRKALVASYQEATRDLQVGEEGSRERARYVGAVRSWAARANRELRSQIVWRVRVIEPIRVEGRRGLRLEAVDPAAGTRLGEPFLAWLSDEAASRAQELYAQGAWGGALEIHGILTPEVQVDVARASADPFDLTPLVGPFAPFAYRVDVRRIAEATKKEKEEAGKNSPP
jgi:hypothetical protein